MTTPTKMSLSAELLRAYENCRRTGRAAAVEVLGGNHFALSEVDAYLLSKLEKQLELGKVPNPPFAYVVARHHALRLLKREAKHESLDGLSCDTDHRLRYLETPGAGLLPSTGLELEELKMGVLPLVDALKKALHDLEPHDRDFLLGFVVRHSFNTQDFAQELGANPNAVNVKFHRIQKRVFLKVSTSMENPHGRELLECLRKSGYKTCQVVKGLLRMLFEFTSAN